MLLRIRSRPRAVDLLRRAGRQSGAEEAFAAWDVGEPLEVWTRSLRSEAQLTLFGRTSAEWDALRLLNNLARLRREERRNPALLNARIARPLFITGMPRSGTTFLHRLLGENEGCLVPRLWQTIYPYPPERGPDRRREKVAHQLRSFAALTPRLASVHPLQADGPQECTEISAHVFRSLRFDTTHEVPSYRSWLDASGHRLAYKFHRRFLQHLQSQSHSPDTSAGGRWILKCPDHVFALDDLEEVYPDACFVFVHRHPVEVLPSVARLTELLRAPFTSQINRAAIGQTVARHWYAGAAGIIGAASRLASSPSRLMHLQYEALVRQPTETIIQLCRHFEIELSAASLERLAAFVSRQPGGGYGRNVYDSAEYGLNLAEETSRFRTYIEHFDLGGPGQKTPSSRLHSRPAR